MLKVVPPKPKTKRITRFEFESLCWELKRRSLNDQQIAQRLSTADHKISAEIVTKACNRCIERTRKYSANSAEIERQVMAEQLGEMIEAYYGDAIGEEIRMVDTPDGGQVPVRMKSPEATSLVVKLMERKAKLLGLDVQPESHGGGGTNVHIEVQYTQQGISQDPNRPTITLVEESGKLLEAPVVDVVPEIEEADA